MSASATQMSMAIKPPSHPTYDLKAVIELALAEDAGDTGSISLSLITSLISIIKFRFLFDGFFNYLIGDVTCMATIPFDMEVEAYFLAKEDGIVAGIALAEMIFEQVDPSLKVCIYNFVLVLVELMFSD